MAGSIEKRGENTYRLVVSTGKNLDDLEPEEQKLSMELVKMLKLHLQSLLQKPIVD